MLLGGLGRFVPCSNGVNHCRLRHVGWERCSRGLTSRPQESASGPFLDQLLLLFHYPPRSSGALLAGTLPPRYCSAKFASRAPFCALLVPGHVAGLITVEVQAAQVGEAEVVRHGVHFAGISGSGLETISTKQKNQHTSWDTLCMLVHVCGRVLHFSGFTGISSVDCKRRRCNQHDDGSSPVSSQDRCGLIWSCAGPRLLLGISF